MTGDQWRRHALETSLSYDEIYRSLDGLTALAVAQATPLRKQEDERDTAFVKRIVSTYLMVSQT